MSSYTHWMPFELACRLRCLQQGSLDIGNTAQNVANLKTLCTAEANGAAVYARWNPVLAYKLEVIPALVPGFVRPVAS